MAALTLLVQWLHIAAGMLWAGGAAMLDLVVTPSLDRLPAKQLRSMGSWYVRRVTVFFAVSGGVTVVFGVLRGTVFGPIGSLQALGSPYGVTWCAALLLSVALALIGTFGVGRAAELLYADGVAEPTAEPVDASARDSARARLQLWSRVQLVGFGVTLVAMVLMAEVLG